MINGKDEGMRELALEEKAALDKLIPKLTEDLQIALLPKDEADAKNAILEVRAGTGGDGRRCLRTTCSACISAMRNRRAGSSRCWK